MANGAEMDLDLIITRIESSSRQAGQKLRIVKMYSRKEGDKAKAKKTMQHGQVTHDDQEAAERLVREHDPEAWTEFERGIAGDNPEIILDKKSGEIIFRPVYGGKKQIRTRVRPKELDRGLYDRLRHARLISQLDLILHDLTNELHHVDPDYETVLNYISVTVMELWDQPEEARTMTFKGVEPLRIETNVFVTNGRVSVQVTIDE